MRSAGCGADYMRVVQRTRDRNRISGADLCRGLKANKLWAEYKKPGKISYLDISVTLSSC